MVAPSKGSSCSGKTCSFGIVKIPPLQKLVFHPRAVYLGRQVHFQIQRAAVGRLFQDADDLGPGGQPLAGQAVPVGGAVI